MVRRRMDAIVEGRRDERCDQGDTFWIEALYRLLEGASHPFFLEGLL
jgi:hypothetical protein